MFKTNKILLLILLSTLFNACAYTHTNLECVQSDDSGASVRAQFERTVKVVATVTGKRKNILSISPLVPANGTKVETGWSGSGVVVQNRLDKGESLILTARHVSHADKEMQLADQYGLFIFEIEKIELTIERLDGVVCKAVQVAENEKADLGVIKSDCIAGSEAQIATELPPVGATVTISGAPLGYHPKNMFIVTNGQYMGVDPQTNELVITNAAVGGFSGSATYYNGRVIGILSKRMVRFEHITLCAHLEAIKAILNEAHFK